MRSAPGSTVRTATRSKTGGGSSGRGSYMARLQRDSGTAGKLAGAQKAERGEGGDAVAHREDGERVSVLEEGLKAAES